MCRFIYEQKYTEKVKMGEGQKKRGEKCLLTVKSVGNKSIKRWKFKNIKLMKKTFI